MNELTIIKHNGGAYIDSRDVATFVEKRHYDLLRDINRYRKYMEKSTESKIAFSNFFVSSSYFDKTGRELPCYLVSKSGAEVIANKLTGEKGIRFTFAYVSRFNEMEQRERAAEIANYHPKLGAFNKAATLIANAYQNAGANSGEIVQFLENVYEPLGIEVLGDGLQYSGLPANMYSPFQMAVKLGIFSMYGRPHAHAIGAILRKLNISPEHKIITPARYGDHIGIVLRYDEFAFDELRNWLINNDFPYEFQSDYCVFHLRYGFMKC
jgi:Rha family phage regulatory protein